MNRIAIAFILFLLRVSLFGQPVYDNSIQVITTQKPTCENANGIISFTDWDGTPVSPPSTLFSMTENQLVGNGNSFQNIKAGRYAFSFERNGQPYIREFALDNYPAILDSAWFMRYFFNNVRGDSCNAGVGAIHLLDPFPGFSNPSYAIYEEMVSNLNFTWSNGQAGPLATGLVAGQTYWVTARIAANNCKFYFPYTRFDDPNGSIVSLIKVSRDTVFFKIGNRNSLQIGTTNIIRPLCDLANGSIQVELLSGNVPPVTWNWSTGETNPLISNLIGGHYLVNVKNGNGCIGSLDIYLEKKNATGFQLGLNLVSVDTCMKNTGKVTMEVTPGNATPPFKYSFRNGPWQNSNIVSGIPEGYHYFIAKDTNGCLAYNYLDIPGYSPFSITSQVNHIDCQGELGSLSIGVTGGLPPYQYHWYLYPDVEGSLLDSLMPGQYGLTLTDANQCKTQKYFYVDLPFNCQKNVFLKPKVRLANNCLPNPINPTLYNQHFIHKVWNQEIYYKGNPDVWLSTLNQIGSITALSRPSFNASCLIADWTIPGISPNLDSTQVIDVLLTPDSLFKNVWFTLSASNQKPLRPGFDCDLKITFGNHSTQPTGSTQMDVFLPEQVEFISSPFSFQVIGNNWYRFDVSPLQIGAWNEVTLVVKANSSVVVGTVLPFKITMGAVPGETNLSDNDKTFPLAVVGSWDPNDISVSPSPNISPNEVDLLYHIDFQNFGNFRTEFVVLKDTLPESVDMGSLRYFRSSDPNFQMEIKGRVLTVRYPYLQLKPAQESEPMSKGFFSFFIKRRADLPLGYSIKNRASIYFDFNPPIQTPEATVTIFQFTQVLPPLVVYPNPASHMVKILGKSFREVRIFDTMGRAVLNEKTDFAGNISIGQLNNGCYFLRMEGEPNGIKFIVDKN